MGSLQDERSGQSVRVRTVGVGRPTSLTVDPVDCARGGKVPDEGEEVTLARSPGLLAGFVGTHTTLW